MVGCRFINLQVSSLTDKWYGESQKLAAAVFSLVQYNLLGTCFVQFMCNKILITVCEKFKVKIKLN